jgi:hypothetical protein
MYFDYRRKRQYVYQIISDRGAVEFEETIVRFLKLGDKSAESNRLLNKLVHTAPKIINARTPPRRGNPGLRSEHFAKFPEDCGYYSWLFQLMYESENPHEIHIGRFENLREEALRLLTITGTPISAAITTYLKESKPLNSSPGPKSYVGAYPPELEQLVADKEKYLVDRFGYDLSEPEEWSKFPKTDFFNHLGSVEVAGLTQRVKDIPETQWISENEEKPNKLNNLNDTRHITFRFVNGFKNVFDYQDFAIWDDWKDDLLPIMEQAAKRLGYQNFRFPRVMLARLPAGGEIFRHEDRMASHYIHKIHVPLITNSETMFHVGRQSKNLPVGEMVEINNKRSHAVNNDGELDRVHLIFECYNVDDYGKRN